MPSPPKSNLARGYFADLLEPATYRQRLYHLLAFPLALTYVLASVMMFALGLSLLVLYVGFPILVWNLTMMRGFAAFERRLGSALLGSKLSRPSPPLLRADGLWASGRQMLADAGTYKTLLYLWLKLPYSGLNDHALKVHGFERD